MIRCSVCQGKGHGVDRHGSTETCGHCEGTTEEPSAQVLRERNALRHKLHPNHPVVGENYRLLKDEDTLTFGDETACVSTLCSLEHQDKSSWWLPVGIDWVSTTVAYSCSEESGDADCYERVFRRRIDLDADE